MFNSPVEILLVEDNPSDVELTLLALKEAKVCNNIHVVVDGEEALEFIFGKGKYEGRTQLSNPKVVLLDLKLPKVDGLEVLKELKKNPETASIPVVMLTSSAQEKDLIESYKLGVNSYIVKPLDFKQFTEAVRTLGIYWLIYNEVPKV